MSQSRTLRAGVFLPPFHPNDEDPLLCMERDFELMQWLDAHNYAEAWIGEHHSGATMCNRYNPAPIQVVIYKPLAVLGARKRPGDACPPYGRPIHCSTA